MDNDEKKNKPFPLFQPHIIDDYKLPPMDKEQEAKIKEMAAKMKDSIDKKFYGELIDNTGPMTFASEESIAKFKDIKISDLIEAADKFKKVNSDYEKFKAELMAKIAKNMGLPSELIAGNPFMSASHVMPMMFGGDISKSSLFMSFFPPIIMPARYVRVRRTRYEWDKN